MLCLILLQQASATNLQHPGQLQDRHLPLKQLLAEANSSDAGNSNLGVSCEASVSLSLNPNAEICQNQLLFKQIHVSHTGDVILVMQVAPEPRH